MTETIGKKILILNYEFPPVGGGGGVATHKLAKGFIQNGYTVDYLTSKYQNQKAFEVIDNINIYRVPAIGRKDLKTANFISMLSYVIFGVFKGISLCRNNKYSFINTHFVIPTGPIGFVLSNLFGLKNILSLHGGDIYDPSKKSSPHKHWYWKKVITYICNNANILVAQSNNTKNNTIKYYRPNKKIEIIPLPYEIYKFRKATRKELGLDENKKYLISIGRLVKRKAYDILIKAVAQIEDKTIECLIISDGPEKNNLEKLAKDLGVFTRIHFLGHIESEEKKYQYLAISDIFVQTSIHEGFGVVLQEAMQVGLPIITSNTGGQSDLITNNINGILIKDTKDIVEYKNNIEMLFDAKSLKKKMTDNGLKKITKYSPIIISNKYLSYA